MLVVNMIFFRFLAMMAPALAIPPTTPTTTFEALVSLLNTFRNEFSTRLTWLTCLNSDPVIGRKLALKKYAETNVDQ